MNQRPLFSAVIPSYNHAEYLRDAVESADRSPLVGEVVIVDDGSADGSRRIIDELSRAPGSKVRVLATPPGEQLGAHARLNQLVEAAHYDWIAILNSDDRFSPHRFTCLLPLIERDTADVFFGDLVLIDEHGQRLGLRDSLLHNEVTWPREIDPHAAARDGEWTSLLEIQNIVATTSNLVFSRAAFSRIGGFRDYRYAHDWDFAIRSAALARVRYVKQMLTFYRLHPRNTIKAPPYLKSLEVRRIFDRLHSEGMLSIDAQHTDNPYRQTKQWLGMVLRADPNTRVAREALAAAYPYARIVERCGELGDDIEYVYAPKNVEEMLDRTEMGNAVLSLLVENKDFVVISRSLADAPQVGGKEVANQVIARRHLVDRRGQCSLDDCSLQGRILRVPRADSRGPVEIQAPECVLSSSGNGAPRRCGEGRESAPSLPGFDYAALVSPHASGKKTVFILPGFFAVGGVERITLDVIMSLDSAFHFVVVCTERLGSCQGSLLDKLRDHADFFDLPETISRDRFLDAFAFLRAVFEPALLWIVNGSSWQMEHMPQLRSIFSGVPFCDQQVYDTRFGWIEHFHRPEIRVAEHYIAINHRIEDTFIRDFGIPREKVSLIHHCFNASRFSRTGLNAVSQVQIRQEFGVSAEGENYFFVGRLCEQKRPAKFITLARAAEEMNVRFVMVGDGPLAGECREMASNLGVTNIVFVPFTDRVHEFYGLASGLIITSEYEGLPVALLEALAMGVPVFSTDVGDIRLVLEQYGSGMVVDVDMDDAEFAESFFRWRSERNTYAVNARAQSEAIKDRFSASTVSTIYRRLFEFLCSSGLEATEVAG